VKRSWSDVALSVWGVLVFLFLFAPIIVIIISAFNTGRLLVAWDGFGFDGFVALLEKPAIRDAVWVSIQTGAIAALVATVLGTLAGIAMARHPGKWEFTLHPENHVSHHFWHSVLKTACGEYTVVDDVPGVYDNHPAQAYLFTVKE
jgi:ABC-type spermidine/putrescine transport system permease subunit I